MKTLVVYYSLTGNVHYVATILADALGATLQPLTLAEPMPQGFLKQLWKGGGQAIFKATPELEPLQHDPDDFEQIVIGTPIWAGTFAPAIRTFLTQHTLHGKRIAPYCCHGGGGKGKAFRTMRTLLSDNRFLEGYACKDPLKQDTVAVAETIREWAQSLVA